MKSIVRYGAIFLVIVLTSTLGWRCYSQSADPGIKVGDTAPALNVTWLKGQPVTVPHSNGVIVVEFWATWCPPCLESIPHLTELQQKYKDKVTIVGISPEDDEVIVKKFVTKMGDKMNYTVAMDKDHQTITAYLGEADGQSIPQAIVVGPAGKVLWRGSPLEGLGEVLAEVTSGKYTLEVAQQRAAAADKMKAYMTLIASGADAAKVEAAGKELEALDQKLGGITPGLKFNAHEARDMVKLQLAVMHYKQALSQGAAPTVMDQLATNIVAVAPKDFDITSFRADQMLQIIFQRYYQSVVDTGDLTEQLTATTCTNAPLLNRMALIILKDDQLPVRNYELALKFAKKAVELSNSKDAVALETYALALVDSGKAAEAVTWQQKAIAVEQDETARSEMTEVLKKYQAQAK